MEQRIVDLLTEEDRQALLAMATVVPSDPSLAFVTFAKASGKDLARDFQGADLRGYSLQGQDLSEVNLERADLRGADLRYAKLGNVRGAQLAGANLEGADIQDSELVGLAADIFAEDTNQGIGSDLRRMRRLARLQTSFTKAQLDEYFDCQDHEVLLGLAGNPAVPPEYLDRFVSHPNTSFRKVLARNPSTSPGTLSELARDKVRVVRSRVAANPATRDHDVELLAADAKSHVRRVVAARPQLPHSVLEQLARDHDRGIREVIAHRLKLPAEIIRILSDDRERWHFAYSSRTNPELLHSLSNDDSASVRSTVASNASTPLESFARLLADPNHIVQEGALRGYKSEDALAQLANYGHPEVRRYLARQEKTSPAILSNLSSDGDPDVRRSIAYNPSTPKEVLVRLSDDREVQSCLASNRSAPLEAIRHIIATATEHVVLSALHHPAVSEDVLWEVVKSGNAVARRVLASLSRATKDMKDYLSRDSSEDVRAEVAKRSLLPEQLRSLAQDESEKVRAAVANNYYVPPDVFAELKQDSSDVVREAVTDREAARHRYHPGMPMY